MRVPEIIDTDRLLLRRPRTSDAEAIFDAFAQDPEVTRYLTWKPHGSIGTTRRFIATSLDHWESHASFPYVITDKIGGGVLGMIEIRPQEHKASLGYVLARAYWGRGLMPEAGKGVVDMALSQPSMYRVESFCDVENTASARTLEKIGMYREGLLRRYIVHPAMSKEPRDCYLYAITK